MAEESRESKPLEVPPAETTATLPRFYGSVGPNSGPKTMWPDLVGLTTGEAEIKIKEDMPGAHIQVVLPNSFVTMDFRHNRVRLYVDESGRVARAPRIG